MTTLFISDLHLDRNARRSPSCSAGSSTGRPALPMPCTSSATCSGPVGDDDPPEAGASWPTNCVADRLGVPAYFIRGNRDFPLAPITRNAGATIAARPGGGDAARRTDPAPARRPAVHRRCRLPAVPRADSATRAGRRNSLAQLLQARLAFAAQKSARPARRAMANCRPAGNRETIADVAPATVGMVPALRRAPHDPRAYPSPGDPPTKAMATCASCSATGTSRVRCCGSTRTVSTSLR